MFDPVLFMYALLASLDITVDVQPLLDQMVTWFNTLFPVFAIGAGIMLGILLIRLVINSITQGFKGGDSGA